MKFLGNLLISLGACLVVGSAALLTFGAGQAWPGFFVLVIGITVIIQIDKFFSRPRRKPPKSPRAVRAAAAAPRPVPIVQGLLPAPKSPELANFSDMAAALPPALRDLVFDGFLATTRDISRGGDPNSRPSNPRA